MEEIGLVDYHVACSDAFLFSVLGPYCTVERFGLRAGQSKDAVSCLRAEDGPAFGCCGEDLTVASYATGPFKFSNLNNSRCNLGRTYVDGLGKGGKTFTGSRHFVPVEIEVYRVE